jgi:hypothetical protein
VIKINRLMLTLTLVISSSVHAIPIDWSGKFNTSAFRIDNFRKSTGAFSSTNGTSEIDPNSSSEQNAMFQTYSIILSPSIIVNDGVTIKSSLSTTSVRGGHMGANTDGDTSSDRSLTQNSISTSSLQFNQLYAELYADSALYRVGRFTKNFGLGAVINNGAGTFDRYQNIYDGFEAEYNFGSFFITPYYAKFYNGNTLTRNSAVSEYGATFTYDNPDKDMKIAIHYQNRISGGNNTYYKALDTNSTTVSHNVGEVKARLIDVYIEKNIKDISIKVEIPTLSGTAGNIYDSSTSSAYKAQAYIFDIDYQYNQTWNYGMTAGLVNGDDGSTEQFEAMFLNQNFKVAHLMFNYNLNAVGDTGKDLFNKSLTNAMFLKFYATHKSDNWVWNLAFITAQAQEVATNGNAFYQHDNGYRVTTASGDQDENLGYEFDVSFDYQWNPSTLISGFFGYHFVGDYFAFTNSGTDAETKDSYTSGIKMSISF